jgi:photosystem II stability/assembly factor-like uncharacterized protein
MERQWYLGERLLRVRNSSPAALAVLVLSSAWIAGVAEASSVTESGRPQSLPCSNSPPASPRWINLGLAAPQLPPGAIPPPQFDVRRVVVDPVGTNRLWVATSHGLFRADDRGGAWQIVLVGADGIFGLAVDPASPSIVLASDSQSIFRSLDGGDSWATVKYAHLVRAIAFDPTYSSVVYAGASYAYLGIGLADAGRLYSSSDGGMTWTVPDPDFQPFTVWDIFVDPESPQTLIAATQNGIFRSGSYGRSWERADAALATAVAFSPSDGGIFVSTASNGYFDGTTVGAVLLSADGGLHFEALFTGFGFTSIVIDPFAPLNIYAGGFPGVVHSSDGGITWTSLNDGLTDLSVTALAIDPRTGSVFAGTRSAGVFELPRQRERVSTCRSTRVVNPRP